MSLRDLSLLIGLTFLALPAFADQASPAVNDWIGSYAVVGEPVCAQKGDVSEPCDFNAVKIWKDGEQLRLDVSRKDGTWESWVDRVTLPDTCGSVLADDPEFASSSDNLCRENYWDEHGGLYLEERFKIENKKGVIVLRRLQRGNMWRPWSLDIVFNLAPVAD